MLFSFSINFPLIEKLYRACFNFFFNKYSILQNYSTKSTKKNAKRKRNQKFVK